MARLGRFFLFFCTSSLVRRYFSSLIIIIIIIITFFHVAGDRDVGIGMLPFPSSKILTFKTRFSANLFL